MQGEIRNRRGSIPDLSILGESGPRFPPVLFCRRYAPRPRYLAVQKMLSTTQAVLRLAFIIAAVTAIIIIEFEVAPSQSRGATPESFPPPDRAVTLVTAQKGVTSQH